MYFPKPKIKLSGRGLFKQTEWLLLCQITNSLSLLCLNNFIAVWLLWKCFSRLIASGWLRKKLIFCIPIDTWNLRKNRGKNVLKLQCIAIKQKPHVSDEFYLVACNMNSKESDIVW